jgi:hypothetical protein
MAQALAPVQWMAAGSVLSAIAVSTMSTNDRAIWMGMSGPLVVAVVSWMAMERAYRTAPQRLNAVILRAFAGKLIFFGLYVTVAIRAVGVEPVPFVLSLTGYFIALHLFEAFWMKRLFVS